MNATAVQLEASPTPILDRLQPMPQGKAVPRSRRYSLTAVVPAVSLPLVFIALLIWSPGFLAFAMQALRPVQTFLDTTIDSAFSGQWGGLIIAVLLPFSLFAVIVVHEIGHLIFGWCAGFQLILIRFGPVRINSTFRFSIKKEPETGASGAVHMIPGRSANLRSRAILVFLGGSFANVLTGTVILLLKTSGPAVVFAVLSIIIGLTNLVPFRRLATLSDGKRIWMLLQNKGQGERMMAIMQLAAELQSGVDPENLSPDFLAKARAVKDESPDTVGGHVFAYSSAWYAGTVDEAAQLLEICLEYAQFSGPAMCEALKSDAAVFQARKRQRIDLAEAWLSEISEKPLLPTLRLRVEAAILEAQEDITGALKKLEEIEAVILTIRDTYQRPILQRSLQRWKNELIEKRLPVSV
jgi:hypothetical protein